jgi:hypothetical protein
MSEVCHYTATPLSHIQMNTLRRMNASTPREFQDQYQSYLREERLTRTFKTYFDSETGQAHVSAFFRNMTRMHSTETLEKFAKYHTEDRVNSFNEMFPPPGNMCEIWNAWERKGRPDGL